MAPPSRRNFPALLAGLDATGYARLLAALRRARGTDARVEDGRVVAADGSTLRPYVPPRWLPARIAARRAARRVDADDGGETGPDAVATTDPDVAARLRERGVPVVGPDRVRRLLLYGVDRATADALCRDHLGRPLDADPPRSVRERVAGAVPESVAVAIAVALLASVVLAAPLGPLGTADLGDDPVASDGVADRHGAAGAVIDPDGPADRRFAPGVDDDGVDSATDLRRAHRAAVVNRSYTWQVTYREYPADDRGNVTTVRTRTVRVANRTTFSETTTGSGEISTPFLEIPRREVYADGTARYVRRANRTGDANGTGNANGTSTTAAGTMDDPTANGTGGESETTETASAAPTTTTNATTVTRDPTIGADNATDYAETASRYVRWFTSGNRDEARAVVHNGTTMYRVTVQGIPYPGIDDYAVTALVARSGFVRELRVTYTRPVQDVAVELGFRYTRVGKTTVTAPAWYERARNRTASNRNGTAALSDDGAPAISDGEAAPTAGD